MTIYIDTENTQCNEDHTKALVEKLQEWGWDVEYGSGPMWQFDSEWDRDDFETAFSQAFNEVTANAS